MTVLVVDTSGLVSLGIAADDTPDPLERCLTEYDVRLPDRVVDELRDVASYDDVLQRVLEEKSAFLAGFGRWSDEHAERVRELREKNEKTEASNATTRRRRQLMPPTGRSVSVPTRHSLEH